MSGSLAQLARALAVPKPFGKEVAGLTPVFSAKRVSGD
jgi:hypothetical protein